MFYEQDRPYRDFQLQQRSLQIKASFVRVTCISFWFHIHAYICMCNSWGVNTKEKSSEIVLCAIIDRKGLLRDAVEVEATPTTYYVLPKALWSARKFLFCAIACSVGRRFLLCFLRHLAYSTEWWSCDLHVMMNYVRSFFHGTFPSIEVSVHNTDRIHFLPTSSHLCHWISSHE